MSAGRYFISRLISPIVFFFFGGSPLSLSILFSSLFSDSRLAGHMARDEVLICRLPYWVLFLVRCEHYIYFIRAFFWRPPHNDHSLSLSRLFLLLFLAAVLTFKRFYRNSHPSPFIHAWVLLFLYFTFLKYFPVDLFTAIHNAHRYSFPFQKAHVMTSAGFLLARRQV